MLLVTYQKGQWLTQEFCSGGGAGGSTNSVEDRGERENGDLEAAAS